MKTPDFKIITKSPLNVSEHQLDFYLPIAEYSINKLSICAAKNTYITNSGIAFRLSGINKQSIYSYSDRLKKYALACVYNFFTKKRRKFGKEETITFIHNYYCPGYYHWITESLPRLLQLEEKCDIEKLILVIPSYYPNYVWESLALFKFKEIVKTERNEMVFAKKVVFAMNPEQGSRPLPELTANLRSKFSRGTNLAPKKRIYISRKNSTRRKIVNEEQLIRLLKEYGFEEVEMENYSFGKQIAMMQETSTVMAIHGAGLSNINFMPSGGNVIELYRDLKKGAYLNESYWRLSNACELDYYTIWCSPENEKVDFDSSNLIVDLEETKTLLSSLFESKHIYQTR